MQLTIDTETTGLDFYHGCRAFMVSILFENMEHWLYEWEVNPTTRKVVVDSTDSDEIRNLILDPDNTFLFHNSLFDVKALQHCFDEPIDWPWDRTDDTLLLAHIHNSADKHDLKSLALKYCNYLDTDDTAVEDVVKRLRHYAEHRFDWRIAKKGDPHFPGLKQSTWWKMDMWLPRQMYAKLQKMSWKERPVELTEEESNCTAYYAKCDVERTYAIWNYFQKTMQDDWHIYERHRPQLEYIYGMEERGMTLRPKTLLKRIGLEKEKSEKAEQKCKRIYDINIRSPKQLSTVLYDVLRLPVLGYTKSGNPSTDSDTIHQLSSLHGSDDQSGFLKHLLNYRIHSKASDYLGGYADSSLRQFRMRKRFFILHPNFNPIGAKRTTRFSSSNPNAQNIGTQSHFKLRNVFGPGHGRLWFACDFSNIEFRLFAYLSGDKDLIAAFEAGESAHLIIFEQLYPKEYKEYGNRVTESTNPYYDLYKKVKNGNFALIYGAGIRKTNTTYGVDNAYDIIRTQLPKIDGFMEETQREALEFGLVRTLMGYPLRVDPRAAHKATNYKVQGSAGEYMKEAIIRTGRYLKSVRTDDYDPIAIATIHDEIIFDFPIDFDPEHIVQLKSEMESIGQEWGVPVPAGVDIIRNNWGQPETYNA